MRKFVNKNVVFNVMCFWAAFAILIIGGVRDIWAWVLTYFVVFIILTLVRAAIDVFILGDTA